MSNEVLKPVNLSCESIAKSVSTFLSRSMREQRHLSFRVELTESSLEGQEGGGRDDGVAESSTFSSF